MADTFSFTDTKPIPTSRRSSLKLSTASLLAFWIIPPIVAVVAQPVLLQPDDRRFSKGGGARIERKDVVLGLKKGGGARV